VDGKRIGITTNHSAIAGREHIVDLLHTDPDVTVTSLFGPENGICGTYEPFLQVGSPFVDEQVAADRLNERRLPGLRFKPVTFEPVSIPGMSRHPKLEGETVRGVKLEVTDAPVVVPVAAGIHLLQVFCELLPDERKEEFFHPRGMPVRAGNTMVAQMIRDGVPAEEIIRSWQDDVEKFEVMRRPFLLYE